MCYRLMRTGRMGMMMVMLMAGLAIVRTAPAQTPPDRPVVEPRSEIERLRWSLEAQQKQLDRDRATLGGYSRWFSQEAGAIRGLRASSRSAQRALTAARRTWNTHINPTCENGQTYANCSCDRGRIGKNYWRTVMGRAARRATAAQRAVNAAVRRYNTNVDRARRLVNQYKNELRVYNDGKTTLARMEASQRNPRSTPDSMDEIIKRAAEQNARGPGNDPQ